MYTPGDLDTCIVIPSFLNARRHLHKTHNEPDAVVDQRIFPSMYGCYSRPQQFAVSHNIAIAGLTSTNLDVVSCALNVFCANCCRPAHLAKLIPIVSAEVEPMKTHLHGWTPGALRMHATDLTIRSKARTARN